ncbi:MAG: AAA family ATPase [Kiritimatiellaeota bacterium]|nr:AAA family ATPase [Kiritimatiellota bacterium]
MTAGTVDKPVNGILDWDSPVDRCTAEQPARAPVPTVSIGLDISRLEKVRHTGGKTIARCPACAEAGRDKAGEHLFIGPDGKFGCVDNPGPQGEAHRKRIFVLIGIVDPESTRPPRTAQAKPAPAKPTRTFTSIEQAAKQCTPQGATLQKVYLYPKNGQEFGAVARYRIPGGKKFLQFHATSAGWATGAPAGKWPLYREKELPTIGQTNIFEGEQCVDAAVELGMHATCSAGGAKAADKTDWSPLAGRDPDLYPDNDTPGEAYAADVARILGALNPPARVRIVRLPGLPSGGDIVDYLEAHDAAEPETIRAEIETLAAQAEPQTQIEAGQLPVPLNAATWALEILPEPDQVFNGAFDLGTKTVIVAPSKLRKSFFLLQAAVSLAAGLPQFLAWDIPKPRRVLFWNLEITPAHFHKRLLRMLRALNLTPADLGDRLLILNTRGMDTTEAGLPQLVGIIKKFAVDVVMVDPIYKLITGDESKQEEIKYLLRGLDRLCTETGAAVVYSHHTGKGFSGDRQAIDRASGSGVLARDFDCQIGLVPHIEDGLMVVEQIARSYPPRDAFCIGWDNDRGCFAVEDGVKPVIQTSRNRNMSGRVGPTLADEDALAVVAGKPLPSNLFKAALRQLGFTERGAREAQARLLEADQLAELQTPTFPRRIMIGTPEGIEKLRQEYQNPKLAGLVS